jgi:hypothetical protein
VTSAGFETQIHPAASTATTARKLEAWMDGRTGGRTDEWVGEGMDVSVNKRERERERETPQAPPSPEPARGAVREALAVG